MRHELAMFVISVAARLVDMHPNTLRKYEREGFLEPARTNGNLRLYSPADIARLRQIKHLVEERGINLAGVELALFLTREIQQLRDEAVGLSDAAPNGRAPMSRIAQRCDKLLDLLGARS